MEIHRWNPIIQFKRVEAKRSPATAKWVGKQDMSLPTVGISSLSFYCSCATTPWKGMFGVTRYFPYFSFRNTPMTWDLEEKVTQRRHFLLRRLLFFNFVSPLFVTCYLNSSSNADFTHSNSTPVFSCPLANFCISAEELSCLTFLCGQWATKWMIILAAFSHFVRSPQKKQ